MTTDLPPLFILYGSATGNAEHISKELRDRANSLSGGDRFFSSVYCGELDSFKKKCLSTWESTPPHHKYPLIVVSSTTGNGEAPENANRFIRFIKKKPSLFMKHCSYCVSTRIKIDLQPKTKVVKIISGGNSKAFYDTKRFRFRFVSGA
jgi:sulfite reductase alpha subunit-like flavoprotein